MKFYSEIVINQDGTMLLVGAAAHALVKMFRRELLSLRGLKTSNNFWVYEVNNTICKAAQSTKENAMTYMNENRVLVSIEKEVK